MPLLIDHLVARFNRLQHRSIIGVAEPVMNRLMAYDYPGNIRELENIIEHAFVLCRGDFIELRHLPQELQPPGSHQFFDERRDYPDMLPDLSEPSTLKTTEKMMIEQALCRHQGNRKQTALDLGINVSTLYRKIKSLKIDPPADDGRRRQ